MHTLSAPAVLAADEWRVFWKRTPPKTHRCSKSSNVCERNCLIISSNGSPTSVRRHTLFCVHIHTQSFTLPYTISFTRRLFAQILTLGTGTQPNPTLASSALHTHTLLSDSLTRNDGAHLPNRPCNLFGNLCLRAEDGSPPDFITFPWPQRLTDLIAQSLDPHTHIHTPVSGLDDEEMIHSHGNHCPTSTLPGTLLILFKIYLLQWKWRLSSLNARTFLHNDLHGVISWRIVVSIDMLVSKLKVFYHVLGDPVGPDREVSQRNCWRNHSSGDRVPLLYVWCGQSWGGLQASQGG